MSSELVTKCRELFIQSLVDLDNLLNFFLKGQCALPVTPSLDPDLNIESGFRFGVKKGSFLEYIKKSLPDMMVDKSRFSIDFKTTHPNGLIFFMFNEEGKKDFVALFVKNHKLVYSFNCGSGPSYLETDFKVRGVQANFFTACDWSVVTNPAF